MNIKFLTDEDFVNYKKASMFIGFPKCTFKCEKDCGIKMCQNGTLIHEPNIQITADKIVERYMNNLITNAVVMAGLEPFDSWDDLLDLVQTFRKHTDDDIVIYTGYYKNEVIDYINELSKYCNIIIKFGRFIPNQEKHYDEVLGVKLASDNQYAERIS